MRDFELTRWIRVPPPALAPVALALLWGWLALVAPPAAAAQGSPPPVSPLEDPPAVEPPPGRGGPVSTAEIVEHRDRVLADPQLQTELPGREALADDRRAQGGAARPQRSRRWALPPAASLSVGWLVLLLGALALAVFLVWLGGQALGTRLPRRETTVPPSAGEEGAPPAPRQPEDDLEELLRRGAYGAAVHLLLSRAVRRLGERRGRAFAPGTTGREVLVQSGLRDAAAGALEELVATTERYLFAGRELAATDFERCRRAFTRLEEPPREEAG